MDLQKSIKLNVIRATTIHQYSKKQLLALLKSIDEDIERNQEEIASATKNYNEAIKATLKGENIPEYYEDFVEPFEDRIEWLTNKKRLIEGYLSKIERKESTTSPTKSGFYLIEDNPDDLTLYQNSKPVLAISIPEMATQWNTKLP